MDTAELRRKLQRPGDGPLLGTWIMYVRTPGIVRMAAAAGLDFVCIDLQHSALDWQTVADMCELGRAAGIGTIVRPTTADAGTVNRIQDLGASGVMFPCVEDRAAVESARWWMGYPPGGDRGVTVGGPASDYAPGSLGPEAAASADARQVLAVQIESRRGLDAVEEIVAGGGIDLVEVGRNDLAASLGVPGEVRHRVVLDALDRIIEACRRHSVAVGLMAGSVEEASDLVARGASCVNWRSDKAILLGAWRDFAAAMRP